MRDSIASIVVTTFAGILFLIAGIVYVFCTWNIIKRMVQKTMSRSLVIIGSLITLTFFFIAGLSLFCYSITLLISENGSFGLRSLGTACYIFGQESMLLTFIYRIRFIFQHSTLQISNCTSRSLMYSWIFSLVSGLAIFSLNAIISGEGGAALISLLGATWILSYILLSVVLVVLFVSKIRTLIIWSSSNSSSVSETTKNEPPTQAMIDMELLYIAIKNGILVPIAITSSIVFTVSTLIFRVLPQFNYPETLVIDITVTTFCISLLFSFNTSVYDKICFKAHSLCQKWWLPSIGQSRSKMELQSNHRTQQQKPTENTVTIGSGTYLTTNGIQPTYNINIGLTNNASNPININIGHGVGATPLDLGSRVYAVSNPLITNTKASNITKNNVSQLKSVLINSTNQSDPVTSTGNNNLPKLRIAQSDFI